jgi:hypothetical protein
MLLLFLLEFVFELDGSVRENEAVKPLVLTFCSEGT